MASKAKVVVRGAFPAGAKVHLFPRLGDTFAAGNPVQTKTATKLGEVEFTGLEEGRSFWAAAEVDGVWRPRAVVAKVAGEEAAGEPFDPTDPATQRQLRSQREDSDIVSGSRDTKNSRFRGHAKPAEPDGFVDKRLGTKDVSDEPSATSSGEVVGPLEHAKKGAKLESDTLTGQAIPVRERPQQEDVKKGTKQESSTELGDAAPVREVLRETGPIEPQEGEPGYVEDWRGGDTTLPPVEHPDDAKRREEAEKAEARSKASKKAAATRKRNAAKKPARKASSGGSSRSRKGASTAKKK